MVKLSCGDASAARACAAADKPGAIVGVLPLRLRHEARRLARLGALVSLRLSAIPGPGLGTFATASARLAAAVEEAGFPNTRRWCVMRLEPEPRDGGAIVVYSARMVVSFEVLGEELGPAAVEGKRRHRVTALNGSGGAVAV
jgi:hypothetical protein